MYRKLRKKHNPVVAILLMAIALPVLPFIMGTLTTTVDYAQAKKVCDNYPLAPARGYTELWVVQHRVATTVTAGTSDVGEEGDEYTLPDDAILLSAYGHVQVICNSGAHTIAYGAYCESGLDLPYVGGSSHLFAVSVGLDYGVDLGAAGQSYNQDKQIMIRWFPNINYWMEEGGAIKIVFDAGAEAHDGVINQVWRYLVALKD